MATPALVPLTPTTTGGVARGLDERGLGDRGTDDPVRAIDAVTRDLERAQLESADARDAIARLLRTLETTPPLLGPLEPGARLWLRVMRFLVERGAIEEAERVIARAPRQVYAWVRAQLDRWWRIGAGVALDASIGATFGVPLQLGASGSFLMVRINATDVRLVRRGVLQGGLDTGVGVAGFVQIGNHGVGASAGAQAQAGLQLVVVDELVIPIFGDAGLAPLLVYLAGVETLAELAALLADRFAALDPDPFRKRLKVELKVVATALAAAEAGVRTPTSPGVPRVRGSRFDRLEGKPTLSRELPLRRPDGPGWIRFDWRALVQRILRVALTGDVRLEAGGGLEVAPTYVRDPDGAWQLAALELQLYAEGEGGASLGGTLGRAIPLSVVPQLGAGGGLRVTFRATAPFADDSIRFVGHELYLKRGDLDVYAGAASEITLALPWWDPSAFTSLDAFLAGVSRATIRHRVALGAPWTSNYMIALARNQEFTVLLGSKYREWGCHIVGYLTVKLVMPREIAVRVLARVAEFLLDELREDPAVIAAARTVMRGLAAGEVPPTVGVEIERAVASTLARAGDHLRDFLTTGTLPPQLAALLDELVAIVLGTLAELELHGELGVGISAGVAVAKGAKARLHLAASGRVTYRADVLPRLRVALDGAVLTARELLELLRGEWRDATPVVNVTPEQLR